MRTTLARFLYSLGITHVGESTAKALATWFGELELVRHLPWPILKLVPDIGAEVAHAIDSFLAQEGNQGVIDALLARGVVVADAHAPSPKLRAKLKPSSLLGECDIPKLTDKRAAQVGEHFDSFAALKSAKLDALTAAGLPADTAQSLYDWLVSPNGRDLVARCEKALAALLASTAHDAAERAGPLDGQTVVLKKTQFVVAGAEAGSKLDKAQELGVDVWDEARLLEFLAAHAG